MWLVLVVAQVVVLALLAAARSAVSGSAALGYLGMVCVAGIFLCVPALAVKLFVAGQRRVGNGALPTVRFVAEHQGAVILGVWSMIGIALAMAMPTILADIRAERGAGALAAADTVRYTVAERAAADPTTGTPPTLAVAAPPVGSPERAAILDALRRRLRTTGRFRVHHLRTAGRWAFVRATEVVELDGAEEQETDLSVAALLEHPAGSTTGWWRVADVWTLPDEGERPLADFARRVRRRAQAEGLPPALLPDDL
jgi:hypothetical protein